MMVPESAMSRRIHLKAILGFSLVGLIGNSASGRADCLRFQAQVVQPATCGQILGPPPIRPFGISATGTLCGERTICNGDFRGFFWDGANLITIPLLPGTLNAKATAVNQNNQVVGYTSAGPIRPFRFENGQITQLPALPGHASAEALSINEASMIVGSSGGGTPVKWTNGSIEQLTLPIGPSGVAEDINDSNQIVGWMGVYPEPPWMGEGFLWDNGKVTALGIPSGSTNSNGKAISNNGQICGIHTIPADNPAGFLRRGFYWNNGIMIDIGTPPPPYESIIPQDINDSGQIVIMEGFIWHNGIMQRLNDLVVPIPGLTVTGGMGINNAGQIAAQGNLADNTCCGDQVAVLLTPIPPLVADLNCDWQVNSFDLMEIIRTWGQCPPTPQDPTQAPPFAPPICPTDLNNDGRVNVPDLLSVINHWGEGKGLP